MRRRPWVGGWRARRRQGRVSHWPPAQSEGLTKLLGGRQRRELTRAQRQAIVEAVEAGAPEALKTRAVVAMILQDSTLAPSDDDWQQAARARERHEAARTLDQMTRGALTEE